MSFKIEKGQLCVSPIVPSFGFFCTYLTLECQVIVGTNGSGKSTVLKLILRLYDPTEGMILVNNQDIKTLKLADLRESVAVLFQDYTHFPLTVSHPSPKRRSASWSLTRGLVYGRSKTTSRLGTLRMHTMKPRSERRHDWVVLKSSSTRWSGGSIRIWNDLSRMSGIYPATRRQNPGGRSITIWFVRLLGVLGTRIRSS